VTVHAVKHEIIENTTLNIVKNMPCFAQKIAAVLGEYICTRVPTSTCQHPSHNPLLPGEDCDGARRAAEDCQGRRDGHLFGVHVQQGHHTVAHSAGVVEDTAHIIE
jgi:hypothetical protein